MWLFCKLIFYKYLLFGAFLQVCLQCSWLNTNLYADVYSFALYIFWLWNSMENLLSLKVTMMFFSQFLCAFYLYLSRLGLYYIWDLHFLILEIKYFNSVSLQNWKWSIFEVLWVSNSTLIFKCSDSNFSFLNISSPFTMDLGGQL